MKYGDKEKEIVQLMREKNTDKLGLEKKRHIGELEGKGGYSGYASWCFLN